MDELSNNMNHFELIDIYRTSQLAGHNHRILHDTTALQVHAVTGPQQTICWTTKQDSINLRELKSYRVYPLMRTEFNQKLIQQYIQEDPKYLEIKQFTSK